MTNICDFDYLFTTWPKIRFPIYDCCGWYHLIDDDEKVASSKKHTQLKLRLEH